MLLDGMVSVLETLRERIQNHRENLEGSETRTRMALIDPLLQRLGWDPANPDLVRPEHRLTSGKGQVDYALLGTAGQPVVFIEAKKLGEPLATTHISQMMTYATMEGISYGILTNGACWEVYDFRNPKRLEERLVLSVSIDQDRLAQCALHLLWLWHSNLAGLSPVQPHEPFIHDVVDTPSPSPSPTTLSPTPPSEGWVPLCDFEHMPGIRAPSSIRFPDGKQYLTNSTWTQMLVQAVRWLFEHGHLTSAAMPVLNASGTRPLISIERHKWRDGKIVPSQQKINGFWLYKSISPQDVQRNILYLVATYYGPEKFGQYSNFRDIWISISSPSPPTSSSTPPSANWMPLCELELVPYVKAPAHIRFPDGKEYPTNNMWVQMLIQTVHWLFDHGHLTKAAVPVPNTSGRRALISIERHKQRDGRIVRSQHPVNGFWLYTAGLAPQNVQLNILYLVATYYGQDKSGQYSDFRDIWVST